MLLQHLRKLIQTDAENFKAVRGETPMGGRGMNFFPVAIQNGNGKTFAGIQRLGIMFYLIDTSLFNPLIMLKSRQRVVDTLGVNGQVFGRNDQVYHAYITAL
jgi:hypothetical protein